MENQRSPNDKTGINAECGRKLLTETLISSYASLEVVGILLLLLLLLLLLTAIKLSLGGSSPYNSNK
jgi:hypothetical protein